eukprot:gene51185-52220_t
MAAPMDAARNPPAVVMARVAKAQHGQLPNSQGTPHPVIHVG